MRVSEREREREREGSREREIGRGRGSERVAQNIKFWWNMIEDTIASVVTV